MFRVFNNNDCRSFGFGETSCYIRHVRLSSWSLFTVSMCWSDKIYTNNRYPGRGFTGRYIDNNGKTRV